MPNRRFRIRHHVNPLKVEFFSTGARRVKLRGQTEVELGCADAQWLFERAAREPQLCLAGVEIREDLVTKVRERVREAGLEERLQILYANISRDLDGLFEDDAVDRFVINFPDPWFKRRHHKRRLLTPKLAEVLCRKLKPGGELFFQSDVWDLALDAMSVLESEPGLENRRGGWSFQRENPFGVKSRREMRVLRRGLPVWRMLYGRKEVSASRARALRAL